MSKAMTEMPKSYDHQATEAGWYTRWESAGLFTANAKSPKQKYTICLPPPNVTGDLHMGHPLNATAHDTSPPYQPTPPYHALVPPPTTHPPTAPQHTTNKRRP